MMKKRILALLLSLLLLTTALPTLAWLGFFYDYESEKHDMDGLNGSSATAYFAGGNGSSDDPYILNAPVHVYNLAWLQFMGLLVKTNEDGKSTQPHFQLTADIDMDGAVIPPIGSNEHPFVGIFDGQNYCISNVTVSTYYADQAETVAAAADTPNAFIPPITNYPANESLDKTVPIPYVGFFGVIVGADASILDNMVDAAGDPIDPKTANFVQNLFLNNITICTQTDKTLIGAFAGYVNGNVRNVGVGTCSLRLANQIKHMDGTEALSLYGLVGDYNNATVKWEERPGGGLGDSIGGQGSGFGGSVDMYSLIRRLTYMYTENVGKKGTDLGPTPYPVNFYTGGGTADANKKQWAINYTSTTVLTSYLPERSILPLNVNTEAMFAGGDVIYDGVTYYEYRTTVHYAANTPEKILSTNTGYIVGGGSRSNAKIRVRINKLASGNNPGLARSMGTGTNANATFTIDNDAATDSRHGFQFVTIAHNGKTGSESAYETYVIDDDYKTTANTTVNTKFTHKSYTDLKLTQYKSVSESFYETLAEGNGMIYGLRFYKVPPLTAESETTTATDVPYAGQEMMNGAINFHLKGAGYITAVAGTYGEQSGTHHMFSLYKIVRGADGSIDIDQSFLIDKVWVKYTADGTKIESIEYNDSSNVDDTYICVFDSVEMKNLTQINAAYYFEIPVIAGDYAITSGENDTGAYLMYLDIGSAGDTIIGGDGGDGSGGTITTPIYSISGLTFLDEAGIAGRTVEGYTVETFHIKLTVTGGNTVEAAITFTRSGQTAHVACIYLNNSTGSSATATVDGVTNIDALAITHSVPKEDAGNSP